MVAAAVRPQRQGAADDRGRRPAARRPGGGDDVRLRRLRLRPRRRAVAALAPARGACTSPPTRSPGRRSPPLVSLLAGELGDARSGRPRGGRAADRPAAHPRRARVERRRAGEPPVLAARAQRPGGRGARSPRCTRAPTSRGRSSRSPPRSTSPARRSRAASPSSSASHRSTYLTRWRMDLAARRLKDTTRPRRDHRPRGRLHVGVRLQPSIQPPPRPAAGPLPARRLTQRRAAHPAPITSTPSRSLH